jgi:hypothetical protein
MYPFNTGFNRNDPRRVPSADSNGSRVYRPDPVAQEPQTDTYIEAYSYNSRPAHNYRPNNPTRMPSTWPDNRPPNRPPSRPDDNRPDNYPDNYPNNEPQRPSGGMPTSPPPNAIPTRSKTSLYAVDSGSIRGCLYHYTYMWLRNNTNFWFYPVYVGRNSVSGYRWTRRRWVYMGVDLKQIDLFQCI